jgi:hypothetical protein
MKRTLIISLGLIALVVTASALALRLYLRSQRVVHQVTTQLETFYGGPVQVGEVDIGLKSTTLKNLAFYEERNPDKGAPWLKIGMLTADVSFWDLVSGSEIPTQITVEGAVLILRFDRSGSLLTCFPAQATPTAGTEAAVVKPAAYPAIEIKQAEIVFRKEGLPDLIAKNVNAKFGNAETHWGLTGTAENVELGKLILKGSLDKESSHATIRANTAVKVHVNEPLLQRLPFISAQVWDELQIEDGQTTAELTVAYDVDKRDLRYRAALAPENIKLFIPAVQLSAQKVGGMVFIDDDLVQLRDIKGQSLGGDIHTDADLDFRGAVGKLRFSRIKVENVNLGEVPEMWNIPSVIRETVSNGKLFGTASLEVGVIPAQHVSLYASTLIAILGPAEAHAGAAMSAAFPETTFHGRGKGEVRDPSGRQEPIEFEWGHAPGRSRPAH